MRKPDFYINYDNAKTKDADQVCSNCTADQCLCFGCMDNTSTYIQNFKHLAFFCHCTGLFVSDLDQFFSCRDSNSISKMMVKTAKIKTCLKIVRI